MKLRDGCVFWRLRILALNEFMLSWNLLEISLALRTLAVSKFCSSCDLLEISLAFENSCLK